MRKARTLFISLLALVLLAPASAAQDSGRPRRVERQEGGDVQLRSDLVTMTVSVSDASGRPLGGLQPDDFKIYEDEAPQRIEHFEPIGDPYSLLLLFDVSGSTETEIAKMRAAAREFIAGVGPEDRLGMMSFARAINIHGVMTSDRRDLDRQLSEISPRVARSSSGARFDESTGTSFYDALLLASTEGPLSAVTTSGRKAIIVFSDCVDSTSSYDFAATASAIERSGASVYVVLFDTQPFSDRLLTQPDNAADRINFSASQLERFYDVFAPESYDRGRAPASYTNLERLEINGALYELARGQAAQLATRTGGRIYPVTSIAALGDAYRSIAAELRTRYSIGYYPTNSRHDGSWRKLRVVVPTQPSASVVAREGYWAPKD